MKGKQQGICSAKDEYLTNTTMQTFSTQLWLFAVVVLLQACSGKGEENRLNPATEPVPVQTLSLSKQEQAGEISLSGQFSTDDETVLSFKTGGIVNNILITEGDRIKKGQLLATIDLTEISAQVRQAEIAYEKAVRDHRRAENLYKDSVITLEQMENARTGLETAREQLRAADFNKSYSEIRAVEDGFVLQKFVNPGQIVPAGTPVLQTNGAGSGGWILRAGVSDTERARIQVNDTAVVYTDAMKGIPLQARVSRKAESTDPATGLFQVELAVSGPEDRLGRLASGMFGKATIKTTHATDTWKVPYEALLDGNGREGYVFVTHDGKTARKVKVTISDLSAGVVQVSAGLEEGGMLIIAGSPYLADGSPIQVVRPVNAE